MLVDDIFFVYVEIVLGVERVYIIWKVIKIIDNCFVFYFFSWIKLDEIGMLKMFIIVVSFVFYIWVYCVKVFFRRFRFG